MSNRKTKLVAKMETDNESQSLPIEHGVDVPGAGWRVFIC